MIIDSTKGIVLQCKGRYMRLQVESSASATVVCDVVKGLDMNEMV